MIIDTTCSVMGRKMKEALKTSDPLPGFKIEDFTLDMNTAVNSEVINWVFTDSATFAISSNGGTYWVTNSNGITYLER